MKGTATGLRAPMAGSALTVAVCAAFGTGSAEAIPVTWQINQQFPYTLDFNHDGTAEYAFVYLPTSNENDVNTFGNGVAGFTVPPPGPKPGPYGLALPGGTMVDGSLSYVSGQSVILKGSNPFIGSYGQFFDNEAFLGLEFHLPGESGVHYGWALLQDPPDRLTVVEVGYETEQNTGIVTPAVVPEPGTLALLAAGAAGVLALRRRQRSA